MSCPLKKKQTKQTMERSDLDYHTMQNYNHEVDNSGIWDGQRTKFDQKLQKEWGCGDCVEHFTNSYKQMGMGVNVEHSKNVGVYHGPRSKFDVEFAKKWCPLTNEHENKKDFIGSKDHLKKK